MVLGKGHAPTLCFFRFAVFGKSSTSAALGIWQVIEMFAAFRLKRKAVDAHGYFPPRKDPRFGWIRQPGSGRAAFRGGGGHCKPKFM